MHFKPDYAIDTLRANNYICHLSAFDKGADIGGADGDAVPGHLGDDVAADAPLPAAGQEFVRVPLVPVAEVIVVACHQVHRAIGTDQQIVDEIELRILNGTYEMGMRLPSVRDLAMLAAVNPNTMQRALSELEEMGLLTTQRNAGRTVTTDEEAVKRARSAKADLLTETFLLQMKSLGLTKEEAIKRLEQGDTKEGENGRYS